MGRVLIVFMALAASMPLLADAPVTICLDNAAKLDPMTLEGTRRELNAILTESQLPLAWTECQSGATIRVRLEASPHEPDTSALGASRREGSRIGPDLAVFVAPVRRLIGTGLPGVLGKALARVAAHELGHYLAQTPHHEGDGLMAEYFTGPRLMAGARSDFRIRW